MHQRAVFPALRWRLSEREKKLSNRLSASSFFQSFWRHQRRQSPISQLICQISQLIFDRSDVNSSHDVPACKVINLWKWTGFVCASQTVESVDKGNGEWKTRHVARGGGGGFRGCGRTPPPLFHRPKKGGGGGNGVRVWLLRVHVGRVPPAPPQACSSVDLQLSV